MQQIYNESFKIQLVNSYESGTKVRSLCNNYNIPQSTMYHWIKQYRKIDLNDSKQTTARELYLLNKKIKSIEIENSILKECGCTANSPLKIKLKTISHLDGKYSIHALCRALGILRSTYYHYKFRSPEETIIDKEDAILKSAIKSIFQQTKGRLGAKKIRVLLAQEGIRTSDRRVSRLINDMGLVCVHKKKYKHYNFVHSMKYRKNVLDRKYTQTKPNKVWVSDITYVYVNYIPYYVCTVIDLFSRKVVAYTICNEQKAELVKNTFKKTGKIRKPEQGLIFHSDQGCQYSSYEFTDYLKNRGIKQSFSNPGCPYDNAVAESFFKSLKAEEVYQNYYKTYEDLELSIAEYVDFFNNIRPHQRLKYLTPNQFE